MKERIILDLAAAIGSTDDKQEIRRTVLETVRRLVWFDTANFWLYPPLAARPADMLVHLDSPQSSLHAYLGHYIRLDEFHQAYNRSRLLIARSTDLLNYRQWVRYSEYYNDFLRSSDVYYLLGFDIRDEQMAYGALCLHRGKSRGDFLAEEITALRLLYPHLVNRLRWLYERQALLARLDAGGCGTAMYQTDYLALLTVREREIVQQVLSGMSNREAAKNLGLSVNTVKMHLQNVYQKLGVNRRSQLFTLYPGI